jgi:NADPH-dependent 2,4-dienoyl-CoA reductase/sulfur reductase-like enzyme
VRRSGTVLVVGASLAGVRSAEALRRHGHDGPIIIVGAEPHRPYDRPPLSKQVLAGSMDAALTALRVDDSLNAEWRLSTRAVALDLDRRVVTVSRVPDGSDRPGWAAQAGGDMGAGRPGDLEEVAFDGLVVATGAHPRLLPGLPDLAGVHVLRTLDDAVALRRALDGQPRVAVVGAGFIGSEVAATCHARGLEVTVVEALPVPLVRALGEEIGRRCARLHTDHGVGLRLGVGVAGLAGTSRVEGVRLADGSVVPADLVVIGVGVAPTTAWLEGSGLDLADGVVCDRWCRALARGRPVPDVVAAGDVARWDHPVFAEAVRVEHWTNAVEQGGAAAVTLLEGAGAPVFGPVPYFWSDQYGTKIQFVGRTGPEVRVVEGSLADDRFVAAYGRDGRLVGAVTFNRPARAMAFRSMIADGAAMPAPTG